MEKLVTCPNCGIDFKNKEYDSQDCDNCFWTKNSLTLKQARDEAIETLEHARIFIDSREKMHPDGVKLYDDFLERLCCSKIGE